jgi:hypothetical protein
VTLIPKLGHAIQLNETTARQQQISNVGAKEATNLDLAKYEQDDAKRDGEGSYGELSQARDMSSLPRKRARAQDANSETKIRAIANDRASIKFRLDCVLSR